MKAEKQNISNWGNFPAIAARVRTTEFESVLQQIIQETEETLVARGNGRCYGDAALHQTIFSTLKLNKLLAFDATHGFLECQAGTLLSDILDFIVPRGFFLPVTPGTKFITVGGAIAANVHGKNHHSEGCFSRHLISFRIVNGAGEVIECSREKNAIIFWNTVGGMGLTGVIIDARFSLKRIETAFIRQESIKAKNLQEIMQLFEASKDWTYTVSWIDILQTGTNLGRSIIMRGEHARLDELPNHLQKDPLQLPSKLKLNIPFSMPSFVLSKATVKAFNFLFYHKQFSKQKNSIIDYDTYFYPLDAINNWNRLYGKKGFTQYQFVLPKDKSEEGLTEALALIKKSGLGSFLTVLKLFGQNEPKAIHAFPMEGYTLALDFKITKKLPALIEKLDELMLKLGGKVYRAKDAFSDRRLSDLDFTYRDHKFESVQSNRLKNQLLENKDYARPS